MYSNDEFETQVRQYATLAWQRMVDSTIIPPGIFFTQPPEVVRSFTADSMNSLVMRIEAQILGQQRPDKKVTETKTVFFEFPASPFQHWKLKHKDSWWLKWFVKKNPVIIAQSARDCVLEASWSMADVYPNQTIAHPQLNEPYVVISHPMRKVWERPHE